MSSLSTYIMTDTVSYVMSRRTGEAGQRKSPALLRGFLFLRLKGAAA